MGVRIRHEFYSDGGNQYRVDIVDSDYSSTILTGFDAERLEIEYERPTEILSPLMPSTCYFTLVDDGSGNFTSFKNDLATAQEDEFKLVLYKKSGGSWIIEWAGVIMTDMVTWDDEPAPRPFEIIAKCGLNRLENILFDKILSSPYDRDALQSFLKVIFDCLSYAGTAQFWNGSTKPYIAFHNTWKDTQQTTISQAKFLDLIYVGREFLVDDPIFRDDMPLFRGANDKPLDAKTILTGLLQLLCCRITLTNGTWYIQQVSDQAATSYSLGYYDYTKAYISTSTETIKLTDGAEVKHLAGGKFGYYPAIKTAKAEVYPSDILKTQTTLGDTLTFDNSSFASPITIDLGDIFGGTGLALKFDIEYWLISRFEGALNDWYIEVSIKLEMGSYRLKNYELTYADGTGTGKRKEGTAEWTTTATDKYYFSIPGYYKGFLDIYGPPKSIHTLLTEEIPAGEYNDVVVTIDAEIKSKSGDTIDPTWPDGYLKVWFNKIGIGVLDTLKDPPTYGQITNIELKNPKTTANSYDIDYGKLRINNSYNEVTAASWNTIMVKAPGDASPLVRSENIDAGYSADEDLVTTMLKETIAMQSTPVKKYMGGFYSTQYRAHQTILYDSEIWVFMGGRFNYELDQVEGDWFGIAYDGSIVPSSETRGHDFTTDKVMPRPFIDTIDPSRVLPTGPNPLAILDANYSASDVLTSLTVQALTHNKIKKGDKLLVLNVSQMYPLEEFTVSADASENDTSISINSITLTWDLFKGAYFAHDPRDYVYSGNIKADDTLQLGNGTSYMNEQILKVTTTNATITEATTDGAAASGTTNRIQVPTDSVMGCNIVVTAKQDSSSNNLHYVRRATFINNGGTTSLQGTVQTIGTDEVAAPILACAVTITANNTDDCIKVEVTGIAATTISWTVLVSYTVTKT